MFLSQTTGTLLHRTSRYSRPDAPEVYNFHEVCKGFSNQLEPGKFGPLATTKRSLAKRTARLITGSHGSLPSSALPLAGRGFVLRTQRHDSLQGSAGLNTCQGKQVHDGFCDASIMRLIFEALLLAYDHRHP